MLEEKGPRHTDDESYYQYDYVSNLDTELESITAEKLYALHYAPFEYNHDDTERFFRLITGMYPSAGKGD